MRQKLSNVLSQDYAVAGGVKSLADILNHSDRPTERNVLDQLAESNAELAEEIRLLLFTFEDVVKLDDRSIQLVLKEVDQKDLAVALRGVAPRSQAASSRTCPSAAPSCCARRSSSSRRSAAASSRRPRAGSSASCAASRRRAPSSSRAVPAAATTS